MSDYKNTIFLPKTEFSMRANLSKMEPKILENWQRMDLYNKLRSASANKKNFTLQDGPPYANGNIHIGHALNKILKDFVIRTQQMQGKNADYIPGWDCHGLPIEWKIEEKYRKSGKNKDEVPIAQFREECAQYAKVWIEVQKKEFQRLGIEGNWDDPYITMKKESDSIIVRELGKFLLNGQLVKGEKPVMWSVVEKTALAEAEVEYYDKTSKAIFVSFKVRHSSYDWLTDAHIVIWTTTPWTIPANRAVCYSKDISYRLYEVKEVEDDSLMTRGYRFVCAETLSEKFAGLCKIKEYRDISSIEAHHLEGSILAHPLSGSGYRNEDGFDYSFDVPLVWGDHVSDEAGTGFVHTAPSHGYDDWVVSKRIGIEPPLTMDDGGIFSDECPGFKGQHVFKVDRSVVEALSSCKTLLACYDFVHSYPHSWRSKKPLIYRNTPQWFIAMDDEFRAKVLAEIERVEFFPKRGKARLKTMIETRPDWCISRQRAWGVPVAIFATRKNGQPLRDTDVMERIVQAFKEYGSDIWFDSEKLDDSYYLGDKYNADDYQRVTDILDVWFDSGSVHAFVGEQRDTLKVPADLYLEGSDQHRGWFQSSLLVSVGTRGYAPYKQILTHGFVLDQKGAKMSKSLGNIVAPEKVIKQYGADILRLWVANSDFSSELRIGNEMLKQQTDIYRRLRNTLRFMLGSLSAYKDYNNGINVAYDELPELERFILHSLENLDVKFKKAINEYNFHGIFNGIHNFCANELSALYFDIRKDSLYCDGKDSIVRRSSLFVINKLYNVIVRWLAPFLPFTAEEAWQAFKQNDSSSVHLEEFVNFDGSYLDSELYERFNTLFAIRRVVSLALERKRAEKIIGSSLQAGVNIYLNEKARSFFNNLDKNEISSFFITSYVNLLPLCEIEVEEELVKSKIKIFDEEVDIFVKVMIADGDKCDRCWKIVSDLDETSKLCGRCQEVLA